MARKLHALLFDPILGLTKDNQSLTIDQVLLHLGIEPPLVVLLFQGLKLELLAIGLEQSMMMIKAMIQKPQKCLS